MKNKRNKGGEDSPKSLMIPNALIVENKHSVASPKNVLVPSASIPTHYKEIGHVRKY